MRFLAAAFDYDGTVAHHGVVAPSTVAALEEVKRSGRTLLLVTGREVEDLRRVFPELELFDVVVAENGAVLYRPQTNDLRALCEPPPRSFIDALARAGVEPISVGHVIVATWTPHEATVLETIREHGLELQVIFNKGAVMVLPAGVNKAFGLRAALHELGLSAHNVVGAGDAENDHALLEACELSVATGNALASLKERCDHVLEAPNGDGIAQLARALVEDDLAAIASTAERRLIDIGEDDAVRVQPYGTRLLVAGPSGSGKSTFVTGLLERLRSAGYSFCIVDPEGDYGTLDGVVAFGDNSHAPDLDAVVQAVGGTGDDVVVNLLGVALGDRPAALRDLVRRLREVLSRCGKPHWLVIDEAHHMLTSPDDVLMGELNSFGSLVLITVHPERIEGVMARSTNAAVVVGDAPEDALRAFAHARGEDAPAEIPEAREGRVVFWRPGERPRSFAPAIATAERRRHIRKYAAGELNEDAVFWFRGPHGKLNLRAQNLMIFQQMAMGVDDETWMHHLRRGDYSTWFRDHIKDAQLAEAAARIERGTDDSPQRTRDAISRAIDERYTAPA